MRQADVVIYAGSLIPEAMLRHARRTAAIHNSAYLSLEQVMPIMLDAARAGRRVVRLHSGDTSIYGAIGEQIAILQAERIDFEVIPGVSSFQAAAAALKCELTLPEKAQTIILTRGEGNTPMPPGESLAALAQHQATLVHFPERSPRRAGAGGAVDRLSAGNAGCHRPPRQLAGRRDRRHPA